MVLLQLIGQGAFIAASLMLGVKLLLLARRTRELPELGIGLAFLLGGGLGYVAWFAIAVATIQGGSPALVHRIAAFGLACSVAGAIWNGVGNVAIFRPGRTWARLYVGALGLAMGAGWVVFCVEEPGSGSMAFWVPVTLATLIYGWGAGESLLLARLLHKRARLGMADPLVVNRAAQWGFANVAIVVLVAISLCGRLVYGVALPAWISALNAGFGLVGATAIWLGFFPTRGLRERLARIYAS